MTDQSSPLAQVSPDSLDTLFNTPPADLTDEQIEKIVIYLEDLRKKFLANPEKAEPKEKGVRKANLEKKVEAPVDISTEDLLGKIGL